MKKLLLSLMIIAGGISAFAAPIGVHPAPEEPVTAETEHGVILSGSSLSVEGVPFLAITAEEDAILQGAHHVGSVSQTNLAISTRARSICAYHGYGTAVGYMIGDSGYQFVTINKDFSMNYVSESLINPYETGSIVGYAAGFSTVTCMY